MSVTRGYTTARRVAAYLKLTWSDDDLGRIEPLIMAAEARIDHETGRSWLGGAVEDEAHPLYGPKVWLDNRPVASIESVFVRTHGTADADATELVADEGYAVRSLGDGALWVPGWAGYDEVLVSYTPTAALPADLGLAATMLVAYWLRPATDGMLGDVQSYSIPGDLSVTFRADAMKGGLPSEVADLLRSYKTGIVFA